ncbi:MAG: DNA polymerase I [bacterium TMED198]|nr:MAG: DNA polymerase I [bacterium TMED198]
MNKNNKKLFLIDGMAIIYRSHFAMIKNPLINSKGQHTSAIFGFINSVNKIIKDNEPDFIAMILDSKEPTFRHEIFQDYKANREKMPDELVSQLSYIDKIIDALNIVSVRKPRFEADDIIGTIVKSMKGREIDTYIVSSDKDLMQLVDEKTFVYDLGNRFKPQTTYDIDKVRNKWGVDPKGIIEFLMLVGDSSDNVPGIEGVGKVTAAKLLNKYKTIDGIVENVDEIKNKRVRKGFSEGIEKLDLIKKLITIDKEVPIKVDLEEYKYKISNNESLSKIYQTLEFHALYKDLNKGSKANPNEIKKVKKYKIISNKNELSNLIHSIKKEPLISLDLETTSLNAIEAEVVGVSITFDNDSGYYIPVKYPKESQQNYNLNIEEVVNELFFTLEDEKIPLCGQNLKYDLLVLKKYGVNLGSIYSDTLIAESLISPSYNSYKLDVLAQNYLGYQMQPIESLIGSGPNQITMDKVNVEKISFYACEDSDIAFQVCNKQIEKIRNEGLERIFSDIEVPLIPVLVEIENNGVFIDSSHLKKVSLQVEKKIKLLQEEIFKVSDCEFNINSPKQLAEILFDKIGLKTIKKRSTAVEVLEFLKSSHEVPSLVLDFRHLSKIKSTYLDSIPKHIDSRTKRVHTSLNQFIVSSGRLSSTNPNFQNIPIKTDLGKEIRKAFVPEKSDWLIMSADYSQIELRILAHFSNEPELVRSFKEGLDVHAITASSVFQIPEKWVTEEQRRTAKVVNYGIIYGAGPYRMSQELGIGIKDAKKIIERYFDKYQIIKEYIDNTIAVAAKTGEVTTLFGRKRKLYNINSTNVNLQKADKRIAINMPIQGTAAELIKIAMINIHNQIKESNLKSRMILQVHDELLFEVPSNEVDLMSKMVVDEMETAVPFKVPIKVDCGHGKNWLEAH